MFPTHERSTFDNYILSVEIIMPVTEESQKVDFLHEFHIFLQVS